MNDDIAGHSKISRFLDSVRSDLDKAGAGDDIHRWLRTVTARRLTGNEPFRGIVAKTKMGGTLAVQPLCGECKQGDNLRILPAGAGAKARLVRESGAGLLDVEVTGVCDVRPGDILCDAQHPAGCSDAFALTVTWTADEPLYPGRSYRIVTLAGEHMALVSKLKNRMEVRPDGVSLLAARRLSRGDTGQIEITLNNSIIHDVLTEETPLSWAVFADSRGLPLGAGGFRFALRRAQNIHWQEMRVGKAQRAKALGQRPFVLWFTGLSGCGKSSAASILEQRLLDMGKHAYTLDGDNVRHGLCKDLGFVTGDRIENMRRITEVAKLLVDAGLIVLVSLISPFRDERERARRAFEKGEFLEVFVDTPLEICEKRDIKGLYAKARAGVIRNFTGIDSPYETPEAPDIHLPGAFKSPEEMADEVLNELFRLKLLEK